MVSPGFYASGSLLSNIADPMAGRPSLGTLKNMKSKMKFYKKDIALYSAEFTAGGVEKLRLKLYPNGKKEADAGWCSVYLEAPKGAELRCRLSVFAVVHIDIFALGDLGILCRGSDRLHCRGQ